MTAVSTENAGRTLHFTLKRHSQFTLQGDKDYVVLAKVPKDWSGDNFILECVAYQGGEATVRKTENIGLYIEGDSAAKLRVEKVAETVAEERAKEPTKRADSEGAAPIKKPRPNKNDVAFSDVFVGGKWSFDMRALAPDSKEVFIFIPQRNNILDAEIRDSRTNKTASISGKDAAGSWHVKDGLLTLSLLNYQFECKLLTFNKFSIGYNVTCLTLNPTIPDKRQEIRVPDDQLKEAQMQRVE